MVALEPEDHDPGGPREHLLRSAGRPLSVGRAADRRSGERRDAARPHAVGEVWLRGPNVTPGYFNRPAETAAALTPDGWLRTGDGGYVDEDGYLFLTDRIKDMIVSGGENVYPVEVEEALAQHADVADVAVIGVPRRALGRGGQGADRPAPGRAAGARGPDRVRARAARRLQAAALGRLRDRAAAHAERQGAQARAARTLRILN